MYGYFFISLTYTCERIHTKLARSIYRKTQEHIIRIEATFGERLDVLIPRLLDEYGGRQDLVAVAIDVSAAWLSRWLKENGYVEERRWVRQPEAG